MRPLEFGTRIATSASGRDAGEDEQVSTLAEHDASWLRSAVDNSSEVIKLVAPDGTLLYANPAFERIFGYDLEEAEGMNVLDYVHPEDLPLVQEQTRKALEAGDMAGNAAEYRFRHKDGTWRHVESVGTCLLDDPAVGGIVVNVQDVTARKRATEALRQSEDRYRKQSQELSLLHGVRTALAHELDPAAVYRTVVEAVAEAYGYTQVSAYHLEGDGLLLQHQVGYHQVIERISIYEGVSGRAVRTRQPILLRDVRDDADFLGAIEGICSEICVPLFDEGEVVGTFNVESTGGIRLTPEDLALMVALGEHLSVAVARAQLHARVRRREEHFRSLVQNSSDVITLLASDGTVRYVSPAIEGVLGYQPEERIDRSAFELIHPDDVERAERMLRKTRLRPGEPLLFGARMRHKNGHWRHIETTVTNRLDEPSVAGIVLNWRDVTERRAAEELLRRTEARYRTLVEQIPAVTFMDRADGSCEPVYVSPQVRTMLGYTPQEWMEGRLWRERLHPDDRERVLASDERFDRAGEPVDLEYRILAKDGSVVWVREETVLIRNEGGEPAYLQGILTDVTERRVAEAALRKSEASLAESQRIAHLGTWEWDVRTDEVWWSDETYRIYGFTPGGVVPSLKAFMNVVHPDDNALLLTAIDEAVNEGKPYDFEHRVVRPDGEQRWVHRRAEVLRAPDGEALRVVGTVYDITDRKALEERLEHRAFHDHLTGLPNRDLFIDRLKQALARTRRRKIRRAAVLFLDLDNFKVVNDSLGHDVGDQLLVAAASRLRECLRPEDTLARFGGDEFVILVEDITSDDEAVRVAERIMDEFRRTLPVDGRELYVGTSIGIALGDARTKGPEELLRDADTAMYEAKAEGHGYQVFDPRMYQRAIRRLETENAIRKAVALEEFVVRYQPNVDLRSGEVRGVEALVRWQHPERGLLDPSEFVPAAERSGIVVPMGEGVLEEACSAAVAWREANPGLPSLTMCVNLSGRQLQRSDLAETVERILRESGLEPRYLVLDITETVYIKVLQGNSGMLDNLKRLGVKISIDDFGVGLSSLAYLKRLPADVLKIDRSFIGGLGEDAGDTAIVRMVIDLAHTLGMEVVAEGVETEQQAALLREMNCDLAQGYHFSKPLPADQVATFLGA
jgi:diguanylate cyclase (GGDEF)-like protein/PAS domain S-box-containing protein